MVGTFLDFCSVVDHRTPGRCAAKQKLAGGPVISWCWTFVVQNRPPETTWKGHPRKQPRQLTLTSVYCVGAWKLRRSPSTVAWFSSDFHQVPPGVTSRLHLSGFASKKEEKRLQELAPIPFWQTRVVPKEHRPCPAPLKRRFSERSRRCRLLRTGSRGAQRAERRPKFCGGQPRGALVNGSPCGEAERVQKELARRFLECPTITMPREHKASQLVEEQTPGAVWQTLTTSGLSDAKTGGTIKSTWVFVSETRVLEPTTTLRWFRCRLGFC